MSYGEKGPSAYDPPNSKPIGTATHEVKMEMRKCAGGCGAEFKCLDKSKQTRARGDCERVCGISLKEGEEPIRINGTLENVIEVHKWGKGKEAGDKPSIGAAVAHQDMGKKALEVAARKKRLKEESKKRLEAQANKVVQRTKSEIKGYDRQKDPEAKWNELVNKAKAKIKTMHRARMEVAGWAMEACDIKWGGGDHWSNHKNVRTMNAFAKEIGVSYKTLAQWVRVKRNIHDKLPKGVWQDDKYMIAVRSDKKIKRNAKPKDVMQVYLKELERKDDGLILQQACKRVSTLHFFIHKKIRWTEVDKTELRELRDYCADIMDRINLELGEEYTKPEEEDFDLGET